MNLLLLRVLVGVVVAGASALITVYSHKRKLRTINSQLRTSVENPRPLQLEGTIQQCGICRKKMDDSWECFTLPCLHKFHKECLKLVLSDELKGKRTCPVRGCSSNVSEDIVSEILAH